jgi:hypothetical protein
MATPKLGSVDYSQSIAGMDRLWPGGEVLHVVSQAAQNVVAE